MSPPRDIDTCRFHEDHANRIKTLEGKMEKVDDERVTANRWAVFLSFLGVVITACAGLLGTLLGFYAKAQGWI